MRLPTTFPRLIGTTCAALLFAAVALLAAPPAQEPTVTAAVPDMAEQGTTGLVVTISGSNFGTDAQVDFLVTGTEDPGGVSVRPGSVKRLNPKTLEATIDVAPEAQYQNKFDIRVRTNGRTGKGTELFRVLEKTTGGGGDSTPPGDVYDLEVVEINFNTVTFRWTAPADDGFDAGSGPAAGWLIAVRDDRPPVDSDWWTYVYPYQQPHYVLKAYSVAPGEVEVVLHDSALPSADHLIPGKSYFAAVRSRDDASSGDGNWSGLSNVVTFTMADYPPPAGWVVEDVERCPTDEGGIDNYSLDFDSESRPAVLYADFCEGGGPSRYRLARRTTSGWEIEQLPPEIDGACDLEFDPVSGEPWIACVGPDPDARSGWRCSLFRSNGISWSREAVDTGAFTWNVALAFRGDHPVIGYMVRGKGGKRPPTYLRLSEWDGAGWVSHDVETRSSDYLVLALVADDVGNVAVALPGDATGDGAFESLAFHLWDGTQWTSELVDTPGGGWGGGEFPDLAWNPIRREFWAVHTVMRWDPFRAFVRFCRRSAGPPPVWSCEDLTDAGQRGDSLIAIDDLGTAYVGLTVDGIAPALMIRDVAGSTWTQPEVVDPFTLNRDLLAIDPLSGQPALTYCMDYLNAGYPAALRFARRLP